MKDSGNNVLMNRRSFLRNASVAGGALATAPLATARQQKRISLVLHSSDGIGSAAPVQWALRQLEESLANAGFAVHRSDKTGADQLSIVACGASSAIAIRELHKAQITVPTGPETLAIFRSSINSKDLIACGTDARGLAYALCELTDRVSSGRSVSTSETIVESPANAVRSVMRQFTSELLDKPWFYDRTQWTHYLDLLASQRFNRFDLTFGLGYDSLNRVDDSYFLFLYPFVVAVPGYDVRATNLSDGERDRNLETIQFISEQTAARGMDFQIGIWMHGYQWPNSPHAQNTIAGLTKDTHAAYCREALTLLLQKCPAVSSVGLRIHGESGVAEGSYDFWATIFDGVKRCGRKVEIDLHAKGIDSKMIDRALATGLPVNLSPKFSAEHLGMPYHQAAIREKEMPVAGHRGAGLMALSEGSRVFTRYGYADLMRDDRKYSVRQRVFAGTQRILLSNDPVFTAAYAEAFQFCGSKGVDLMEPLTCRGRRGSGVQGRRDGYVEARLETQWDWEKYTGWYRTWGRLLYNPRTNPEVCARSFVDHAEAAPLQSALATASRILPIVTTAYLPSAACDGYWPEIYWNQPLTGEPKDNPYGDTLAPKVFQNASPLDPQLFSGMQEFAQGLLDGQESGKYSPVDVAQWLEDGAGKALQYLRRAGDVQGPEAARAAIDVKIQAGLGYFFAAKFRAGVLYAVYEQTKHQRALEEALRLYRVGRDRWAEVVNTGHGVYSADLSVSDRFDERGQWADRLAGIEEDIAEMEQRLGSTRDSGDVRVAAAITDVINRPPRPWVDCHHTPPRGFRESEAVAIELGPKQGHAVESITLYYRQVNQAERYQRTAMNRDAGRYLAEIPATYTDSPYPLQYYFELRASAKSAWLYPGFNENLTNQPYFIVRKT